MSTRRRRRSSKSSRSPVTVIVVVLALAAAGWFAQRYALPAWRVWRSSAGAGSARDVCATIETAAIARAMAVPGVTLERPVAAPGMAVTGSCIWHGGATTLTLLVFSESSLAKQATPLTPKAFFDSSATGLEYAYKSEPVRVLQLGDEALAAGWVGGEAEGQLLVRHADQVLQIITAGGDRALAERAARVILAVQ